ncbi:MAG: hypothetical protein KF740_20335 [Ramlibacter sp.]|nr:hypothetical protein [Ramlibacter sp.]MBX3732515.1 hypothetical protein [Verrucomicrobiae bacterium]
MDWTRIRHWATRIRVIVSAWPPAGALFLLLSFVVTALWLYEGLFVGPDEGHGWLEPLAAILAGLGAFILAAILIIRRVDGARNEASGYHLARGLATGYYFNFLRPLIDAVRDPKHPVHATVSSHGNHRLSGIVVGIPQEISEFDPARHGALFDALSRGSGAGFDLKPVEVLAAGRPRPIHARLAVSRSGTTALIVDIPTTLAVIADFAEFLSRQGEDGGAGDEFVTAARKTMMASAETGRFQDVLEEFMDVVHRVGSMEPRPRSPAPLVHIVPLRRLRRRLDELADS